MRTSGWAVWGLAVGPAVSTWLPRVVRVSVIAIRSRGHSTLGWRYQTESTSAPQTSRWRPSDTAASEAPRSLRAGASLRPERVVPVAHQPLYRLSTKYGSIPGARLVSLGALQAIRFNRAPSAPHSEPIDGAHSLEYLRLCTHAQLRTLAL
jgi:hypothetical protein